MDSRILNSLGLCAKAGTAEYGAITLTCQRYGRVVKLFDVPKHCFYPSPNVDSAVITIIPAEKEDISVKDEEMLKKLSPPQRYEAAHVRWCFEA